MIYLGLSLFFSSAIFLLFKLFNKFKVDTFPAIVINYITATSFGVSMVYTEYASGNIIYTPLIRNGVLLGFLFIGLFYLMAKISQEMGAGISSVATKLSLVIPAIFFMFFNDSDTFSWLKIAALIIAMPGVYFTVHTESKRKLALLLPLLLFLGSGFLDIVLAYTDQNFSNSNTDKILLTFLPFTAAGATGIAVLLLRNGLKIKLSIYTVFGGIILGLINFGSIYYLLKTFEMVPLEKSQIIPINNLGIVITSALAAYLFMNERLSKKNTLGLVISILAILLLIVDSYLA